MSPVESQIGLDLSELRDIARDFATRGKHETAEYLLGMANRLEVLSGAFRTMQARHDEERRRLFPEEIDDLAQQQNVWVHGALQFDLRAFAAAIEKHHGITAPEWEAARDYCA